MSQNRHDLTQIFWGFSGPAASWGSSQGPGFTWFHRDSSMMGCSWIRFGITQKIMIFETLTIMWCHVESWKKTKDTEITHMKYYNIYISYIQIYAEIVHMLSHFVTFFLVKSTENVRIPTDSLFSGIRRQGCPSQDPAMIALARSSLEVLCGSGFHGEKKPRKLWFSIGFSMLFWCNIMNGDSLVYITNTGERVWSPQCFWWLECAHCVYSWTRTLFWGLVKRAQLLWHVHNFCETCTTAVKRAQLLGNVHSTTSLKRAHIEYLKRLGGGETRYTMFYPTNNMCVCDLRLLSGCWATPKPGGISVCPGISHL